MSLTPCILCDLRYKVSFISKINELFETFFTQFERFTKSNVFCFAEVQRGDTEVHHKDPADVPVHHQGDVAHHRDDAVHLDTDLPPVHEGRGTEGWTAHQRDRGLTVIGG